MKTKNPHIQGTEWSTTKKKKIEENYVKVHYNIMVKCSGKDTILKAAKGEKNKTNLKMTTNFLGWKKHNPEDNETNL